MRLMIEGWPTGEALGEWPIIIQIGEGDSLFPTRIGEKETQVLTVGHLERVNR